MLIQGIQQETYFLVYCLRQIEKNITHIMPVQI